MLGGARRRNVPETSDSLFEIILSSASLKFSAVPSVFRGFCELIVPASDHEPILEFNDAEACVASEKLLA